MNIKQIKKWSHETSTEIHKIANSICPKLFKPLQYEDIFDDAYRDDSIQNRYKTQLVELIDEYRTDLRKLKQDFITQYFEDWLECSEYGDYGIDTNTGLALTKPDKWMNKDVNFLPRVEVAAFYESVMEIHLHMVNLKPFWEREDYTIISPTSKRSAKSARSPVTWIDRNRELFPEGHLNAVQVLLDATKLANTFEYELHIEPLSHYMEREVTKGEFVKSIERHAKLRDFLEGEQNKSHRFYASTYDVSTKKYKFAGGSY